MPRAHKYWVNGAAYHLTHRCHDRAFLLASAEDRSRYVELLREHLHEFEVSLLNYTVTCNHIHLLVTADEAAHVARLMRTVQGEFAAAYNRRNGRSGAFWSDRYHATIIDDGEHLMACMRYIDLNMVRAGVITHPDQWMWTGWHELVGMVEPSGIINISALLKRLDQPCRLRFRNHYRETIEQALLKPKLNIRESRWTESVAMGSLDFLQHVEADLDLAGLRRRLRREESAVNRWCLREQSPDYPQPEPSNAVSGICPNNTINYA